LIVAEIKKQGEGVRVQFPFVMPTPGAVFQRADTLWLVFDTQAKLDVACSATIRAVIY
jgi:hypothetical protein